MTVRLSWGILYDMPHTLFAYGFSQAPPWAAVIALNNVSLADPWATYAGGDPFPLNLGKNATFPTFSSYTSYPLDLKVPYLQQWNLSVQKQIGANWLFSASYLGNSTIHLWAEAAHQRRRQHSGSHHRQSQISGACCTWRIRRRDNTSARSTSSTMDRRPAITPCSFRLSIASRVTSACSPITLLSHCISGPFSSELDGGGYSNPANRNSDRGNCVGIDHRHLANFSALQEAPRFSDKWMRALASDWKLSEIISNSVRELYHRGVRRGHRAQRECRRPARQFRRRGSVRECHLCRDHAILCAMAQPGAIHGAHHGDVRQPGVG